MNEEERRNTVTMAIVQLERILLFPASTPPDMLLAAIREVANMLRVMAALDAPEEST